MNYCIFVQFAIYFCEGFGQNGIKSKILEKCIMKTFHEPFCPCNQSDLDMFSNHSHIMPGDFQSDDQFMMPRDMTFTSESLFAVICYSVLLPIGAAGNLTVFVTLFRARQRRSRVNRFIMHLSLADMIVVFIMMPLEIGWHVTVSWKAGDIACRALMFFRAFGFYLSSFILIVISLDRVFTVTPNPMKLQDAEHRGKVMLILSWIMSTVASLPQVSMLSSFQSFVIIFL